MLEISSQKALVERHQDERFVLLGINTDDDKDEYLRKRAEFGITWRSSWQGGLDGPIPTRWGVDSYPTIFVLDAKQVIRHVNARGEALDTAVEELLKELEAEKGR